MNSPLNYRTITAGQQIMLPLYPALLLYVGLGYINGDPRRTMGPSFDAARQSFSIQTWGWFFVTAALVVIAGYVIGFLGRSRIVVIGGLLVGMALCFFWSYAFYRSAAMPPPANGPLPSLNGWFIWAWIGLAFFAGASSYAIDRPRR